MLDALQASSTAQERRTVGFVVPLKCAHPPAFCRFSKLCNTIAYTASLRARICREHGTFFRKSVPPRYHTVVDVPRGFIPERHVRSRRLK